MEVVCCEDPVLLESDLLSGFDSLAVPATVAVAATGSGAGANCTGAVAEGVALVVVDVIARSTLESPVLLTVVSTLPDESTATVASVVDLTVVVGDVVAVDDDAVLELP